MERGDFKNITKEHIDYCKKIIKNNGDCGECLSCPFDYENSKNNETCWDNNYSNTTEILLKTSKEFIEKFEKSFIGFDLNLLKNYEFQEDLKEQYDKIVEEVGEFYTECIRMDKEKQIAEGLDVITAMLNYLIKVGITEKDFQKHIKKLERYKK